MTTLGPRKMNQMNQVPPEPGRDQPMTRQRARENGIPIDSIWPMRGQQQQNVQHNDHPYNQTHQIISPFELSRDSNPFRLSNPNSADMSYRLNRAEQEEMNRTEAVAQQQFDLASGGQQQNVAEVRGYCHNGRDDRNGDNKVERMARGTIPPEGQIEFEIPLVGQAPQIAHTQQFFYHPQPVSAAGNFGYWQGFVQQPQTTPRQDQPPARGGNQPMRAQPQIMPQSQPRANLVDRHPIGQQGNVGLAFANQQHGSPRVHFTDQTPRIQRQMPLGPPPGFQQQPIPSVQSSEQLLMLNSFQCLSHTLVLDRLPELKGNEGADKLKSFFKKFDNATQTWSDKERIGALESKVYGRAERALNAALNTQPYVYSSIRRHMIQQLEDTDAREMEAFDTLMRGVIRKPGETVDDLGERVSGLVRRAYPGLSINLADEYSIKHLIRSLGDPDLAMNLELSRRPAMSLDEFVSMAARAEATRRTFRQQNLQNTGMNRKPDVQQQQTNFHFQPRSQWNGQAPTCYNCGMSGHISRDCYQPRRELGGSNQSNSQANERQQNAGNWVTTGANNSGMSNGNYGNFQQPQTVQRAAVPPRNIIRQNLLAVEEERKAIIGVIHASEKADYSKDMNANVVKEGRESIGKLVVTDVVILGVPTKGVIDCGAQLSLLSASFLENANIDCSSKDFEFAKGCKIFDVNGKEVGCIGSISLPVHRKGVSVRIRFNITRAPLGFDLLFGTDALDALGFQLFDEREGKMVKFESNEPYSINPARVFFNTISPPVSLSPMIAKMTVRKSQNNEKEGKASESQGTKGNGLAIEDNCIFSGGACNGSGKNFGTKKRQQKGFGQRAMEATRGVNAVAETGQDVKAQRKTGGLNVVKEAPRLLIGDSSARGMMRQRMGRAGTLTHRDRPSARKGCVEQLGPNRAHRRWPSWTDGRKSRHCGRAESSAAGACALERAGRPSSSQTSHCLESRVDIQSREQLRSQCENGHRWGNRSGSSSRSANWRD